MIHRSLAALAAAITLVAASATTALPAHGLATLVACPLGTQTVTWSPGLTYVPQPTSLHIEGILASCVSATDPALNNATFVINGSGTGSCLTSSFPNATMVVDWNDGPDSVITYDLTVNIKPAGETVFVSVGQVDSGQFAGGDVVRTTAEVTLDLAACLTTGLNSSSGPTSLTVTG
ncbi:hypothetical protein MF672_031100 [Actinomadura sp. ATCC 31491]|uniref:Ig-like domain-containing protein n=1 Tax=Actinomadura luzonensis TaxID=2805427 RepID=A0ABT0G1Z6_9ACTN|nr:hypothetical protein [Actinomadura luzonensis]MCK2218205.1 hypothetical protein [Actinomadura luzonensis]